MTSDAPDAQTVVLNVLPVPAGWMIAPTSFLVDRFVPQPECVWLPPTTTGGGEIRVHVGNFDFEPPDSSWVRHLLTPRRGARSIAGDPIIDLRAETPGNWAHFLNNHLAFLAFICRTLDRPWNAFQILLPQKTPGYIKAVADLTELACLYTDDIIQGQGVRIEYQTWTCIRGERRQLLSDPRHSPVAAAIHSGKIALAERSQRLFLSRRDARRLVNEAEVEALLLKRGFRKVYMEDFDVSEQIRLVLDAEEIVAIHGAALAPLLYRTPGPFRLLELFPVGHITNVYRATAAELGGTWIGVRGYIDKSQLDDIYRLDQPFRRHSLKDFRIDLRALELALEGPPAPL